MDGEDKIKFDSRILHEYLDATRNLLDVNVDDTVFLYSLRFISELNRDNTVSIHPTPLEALVAGFLANAESHPERLEMITSVISDHQVKEFVNALLYFVSSNGQNGLCSVLLAARIVEEAGVLVDRLVIKEFDRRQLEVDPHSPPHYDEEKTSYEKRQLTEHMSGILYRQDVRQALTLNTRFRESNALRNALRHELEERGKRNGMERLLIGAAEIAKAVAAAERKPLQMRAR